MNDDDRAPEAPPDLTAQLEALVAEVRRQGRAAIGAQAAAEACLEAVKRLPASEPTSERVPAPAAARPAISEWLPAMLPTFDALGAAAEQGRTLEHELDRVGWVSLVPRLRRLLDDVRAFLQGLEMLQRDLDVSLRKLGITVDRTTDVPVDPDRHRVLRVRPCPAHRAGKVLEVVRPGYFEGDRCLRETEVSAGEERR